jgi:hypothetical protein
MSTTARIGWLRVLLAGFVAEILVIALVVPVSLLFGKNALTRAAPPASLLACFLFAIPVGRRLDSRFVLYGVLVGIVATLIYVALTRGRREPVAYPIAHALKISGGAAADLVAARRQMPAEPLQTPAGEAGHL